MLPSPLKKRNKEKKEKLKNTKATGARLSSSFQLRRERMEYKPVTSNPCVSSCPTTNPIAPKFSALKKKLKKRHLCHERFYAVLVLFCLLFFGGCFSNSDQYSLWIFNMVKRRSKNSGWNNWKKKKRTISISILYTKPAITTEKLVTDSSRKASGVRTSRFCPYKLFVLCF